MYKKHKSTVYYANNEPKLRPITSSGTPNQFVNIMSIYGKAIIITPAKSVCNQYDVCFELNHANNWLKKRGLNVVIPQNLNYAIVLDWNAELGATLAGTFKKYLAKNIKAGYLVEYDKAVNNLVKATINEELKKYGLTYSMFMNNKK